jgi:hypothetical protein
MNINLGLSEYKNKSPQIDIVTLTSTPSQLPKLRFLDRFMVGHKGYIADVICICWFIYNLTTWI